MKPVFVRLRDEGHRMPHPLNPATLFPAEGETVNGEDPVWMQLINDGSLVEVTAPKSSKEKA